jgi:ribonuclease HI
LTEHLTVKSFTSLTEAEAFMSGNATKSPTNTKFYAVQRGRVPGVYTNWPSAQQQITGWKLPKHKSFGTRAEAERFVAEGKSQLTDGATPAVTDDMESEISVEDGRNGCKVGDTLPLAKRVKAAGSPEVVIMTNGYNPLHNIEPGTGPLPEDAEDGFDRTVWLNPKTGKIEPKTAKMANATKKVLTGVKGWLEIYTDGSSLGNGRLGATSGVGVYFGQNDPRYTLTLLSSKRRIAVF